MPTLNAASDPIPISNVTSMAAAVPVRQLLASMANVGVVAKMGAVPMATKNISTPSLATVSWALYVRPSSRAALRTRMIKPTFNMLRISVFFTRGFASRLAIMKPMTRIP